MIGLEFDSRLGRARPAYYGWHPGCWILALPSSWALSFRPDMGLMITVGIHASCVFACASWKGERPSVSFPWTFASLIIDWPARYHHTSNPIPTRPFFPEQVMAMAAPFLVFRFSPGHPQSEGVHAERRPVAVDHCNLRKRATFNWTEASFRIANRHQRKSRDFGGKPRTSLISFSAIV